MDRDFRIGKGVELVTPTSVHDIHNLYDFAGFVLVGDGSSWLFFAPTPELGAGRIPVAIEFSGIDFLELGWNPGVIGTPYVDEIGFKSPGDHDDNWLLTESQASSADHMFIRFGADCCMSHIRIHCRRTCLHIGVSLPAVGPGCQDAV